ncbi:DUF2690 domain-containing protein [Rathayibacter sp. AY2B3]|uniref:DUF2690 domain-containing protein n=1 Tax=Rathayibacter sp. AY2B3 TaxID=2080569 RepID=UPI0011B03EA6|nr:DUF2690 domain-containing protein [Rathayibacter sp. AY2B3]
MAARRRTIMGVIAALFAVLLALTMATPAQALSGSGYNNTLPYQQGCGRGAYAISSKAILGGTVSMVYSPTCQTNWLEWYGPSRYTSKKMYQPVQTAAENDTASWSYSRQVYAPGATVARGEIYVWVDNTGRNGSQAWSVRCGSTCEWVQFN